jgi:hypothetical protein
MEKIFLLNSADLSVTYPELVPELPKTTSAFFSFGSAKTTLSTFQQGLLMLRTFIKKGN